MEFGDIIPQKYLGRFTVWILIAVSMTRTESQTTSRTIAVQNPTTGEFVNRDYHCDNQSKFFDLSTYFGLHCNISYTKQYCDVTDDKEWECLLQMADMQDSESCECKRNRAIMGPQIVPEQLYNNQYCMHVEFCVFMETNWECNPDFKCYISNEGGSGIKCSDGNEDFFPTCSRHLLHCKAIEFQDDCLSLSYADTVISILTEECLSDQFEEHDVLFLVEKSHIANRVENYDLKAISKDGRDVTSKYCRTPQEQWKYILPTIVVILVLSSGAYGFYRFKRYQKAQDQIWDARMDRNIDRCQAVFTSGQTQESLNTIIEQCLEIKPEESDLTIDEERGEKSELASACQTAGQNSLDAEIGDLGAPSGDRETAFGIGGLIREREQLRIGSFDNATYSGSVSTSGLTNNEDDSVFTPGCSGYSNPPYANSPSRYANENSGRTTEASDSSSNQALLGDVALSSPPCSDGYFSKNGESKSAPVYSNLDNKSALLLASNNSEHNTSVLLDGYSEKSLQI